MLLLHVICDSERGTVAFYGAFFNIHLCGVLTALIGCCMAGVHKAAAISVHILCKPCIHAPVYGITSCKVPVYSVTSCKSPVYSVTSCKATEVGCM